MRTNYNLRTNNGCFLATHVYNNRSSKPIRLARELEPLPPPLRASVLLTAEAVQTYSVATATADAIRLTIRSREINNNRFLRRKTRSKMCENHEMSPK